MVAEVTRKPPGAAGQSRRCQVFTLLQPEGVCLLPRRCRWRARYISDNQKSRAADAYRPEYIKNLRFQYVNGPLGIMRQ
jgi:hypothetical protein